MQSNGKEFEIRGHQKVIEHYRRVLADDTLLSRDERERILVKMVEEQRRLDLLLKQTSKERCR